MTAPAYFQMRAACQECGSTAGVIEPRGGQACVFCTCGLFQYNAPKTEQGKPRTILTTHEALTARQKGRVMARANGACELCGKRPPEVYLEVGHALSVKDGHAVGAGDDVINCDDNLLVLCRSIDGATGCNMEMGALSIEPRLLLAIIRARRAWKARRGGA